MSSVVCFLAAILFQSVGSSSFSPKVKTALILSAVPISFFGLAALLAGKKLGGNNCFKSILQLFQLAAVLVVHKSSGDPDTGQQVVFVYLLIFVDLLNFRHHLLRVLFTFSCLVWAYPNPSTYVVACLANIDAFIFLLLQTSLFKKERNFDWLESRQKSSADRAIHAKINPLAKVPPSPTAGRFIFKKAISERKALEYMKVEGDKNYSNSEDCVVMKMTNDGEGQPKKKEKVVLEERDCKQAEGSPAKTPKEPPFAKAKKRTNSLMKPSFALCNFNRLQRSDSLGAKNLKRSYLSKEQ